MLKTILIRRAVAIGFSVVISTGIPFLLQDRPVLRSAWGRFGPVIVDAAKEQVDTKLNELE